MTIEQAIHSAIEFETRVRDTYSAAADQVGTAEARRFFQVMSREEQGHIDYLRSREQEWRSAGTLTAAPVPSALEEESWVRKASENLQASAGDDARTSIVEHLYAALRLEEQASTHYRDLIAAVEHPDAEAMFGHFLEIEDGHIAVVQAEIDFQAGTGVFYDMREFTLDG